MIIAWSPIMPDDEDNGDNCSSNRASLLATEFSRDMQVFLLSDLTGMLCLPQSWIRSSRMPALSAYSTRV